MSELIYTCSCEAYQKRIAELEAQNEKFLKIIYSTYQVCGVHDVGERILDILCAPESATDEMVEAMLPYKLEAAQAQAVPDSREAFEAQIVKRAGHTMAIEKGGDGSYLVKRVADNWEGWQLCWQTCKEGLQVAIPSHNHTERVLEMVERIKQLVIADASPSNICGLCNELKAALAWKAMLTAAPTPAGSQQDGWICTGCGQNVPPVDVTYEEYHDPRHGGCGCKVVPNSQPPAANAAPTRHPNDELVSMFCTAIDNLGDMPISPEWAESFAERGHKLLADNNYFRDANAAQDVRNQALEEAAAVCESRKPASREEFPEHWKAYEKVWGMREFFADECAMAIRALKTPAKREG